MNKYFKIGLTVALYATDLYIVMKIFKYILYYPLSITLFMIVLFLLNVFTIKLIYKKEDEK